MQVKIETSWQEMLKEEFAKPYFQKLVDFVKSEYHERSICPQAKFIFKAFNSCPVSKLKVVILGQDPYHSKGVANGLAFSANPEQRIPPSLINIFKEIEQDIGTKIPNSPDLTRWAEQGVLLLNTTLTVRQGLAGSHQNRGWEEFTDGVIKKLSDTQNNLVFLLWGAYAQKKRELIDSRKHLILQSAHPSPFSAHKGFLGNKHFSKTNQYLAEHNIEVINW